MTTIEASSRAKRGCRSYFLKVRTHFLIGPALVKVTFFLAVSCLAFAPLLGCSSTSNSSGDAGATAEIDAAKAKQIASAAVPGTASEPRKLDEGEEHRWIVSVAFPSGATVDVEITRSTGVLEEITGEERPFDYDIPAPKPGQMTFAQAKDKALAAQAGNVEVWEVKPPSNLYEFYVRDAAEKLWEIKMSADKGEIQSKVEKAKPD